MTQDDLKLKCPGLEGGGGQRTGGRRSVFRVGAQERSQRGFNPVCARVVRRHRILYSVIPIHYRRRGGQGKRERRILLYDTTKQPVEKGSGVREAGCQTVLGARGKPSGMFWGKRGAEHVLARRCIHSRRRLGLFWKDRLNNHAARNDRLTLAA